MSKATPDDASGIINLISANVKASTGGTYVIKMNPEETLVSDFKELVAAQSEITADRQRLIYKGHVLKDAHTLASYKFEDGHTIHLVISQQQPSTSSLSTTLSPASSAPRPVIPRTSPATVSLPTSATSHATSSNPAVRTNPFAGLPGLSGNPSQSSATGGMGGMGGMDPATMQAVMNSPMMDSLLNNPEMMRSMMMQNPQVRQVMEQNPEMAQAFSDPATFRQIIEATRNPAMMQEMMRTTDLAMSNIENHPEGFNYLRRMYQNVQEPLANAHASSMDENPFAALLNTPNPAASSNTVNPTTTPLPNPWSSSPSTGSGGGTGGATTPSRPAVNPVLGMSGMGALGGLGVGGAASMESMLDDPLVQQMFQSPEFQASMQRMLSDPQMMQQMLSLNPQMQQALSENPQLSQMMQSPEFIQRLSDPNTLRAMMTLQRSMGQLQNSGFPTPPTGARPSNPNAFANLFGGGLPALSAPVTFDPTRYQTQLGQLMEMGFTDADANLRALTMTGGNVEAAIERLLSGL